MDKIGVHPMSIGPDHEQSEIFASFYALGCLVAYAKGHHDGALRERFEFSRITPRKAREVPQLLDGLPDAPGLFLFSSYVWNHDANMGAAREIKRRWPGALVIFGGPHIPRAPQACEEFFAGHPDVDVTVRHEGEVTLAEILTHVANVDLAPPDLHRVDLATVDGLEFRRNGHTIRTPDRGRTTDLSSYPSPYLTGEFEHWIDNQVYLPVESNRGCPYGCTFCDWGAATLSKIARISDERVFGEIDFAARHRIRAIGYCDANFGILPRDLDIVRYIIETKNRYGYPSEIGYTNAKTASPRLTELIKLLHDGGLVAAAQISMQTIDDQVLKNVERANIKTSEYRKMIAFFHREEIPAVSDLMVGLPGQTFETCKKDLQFCFDHKVVAVIFATSVMPNAPMADADYQRRFQITVGQDGFVESTYSFSREEYAEMFDLCLGYKLFVKLGLLKYVLYFVQVEHGVNAMDFVAKWLQVSAQHPERYPISGRIRNEWLNRVYRGRMKDWLMLVWTETQGAWFFESFDLFQREVLEFLAQEHGLRLEGSDVDAVLLANRSVMPRKDQEFPARIPLAHDVPAYFAGLRKAASLNELTDHVPLAAYGPGTLELRPQPRRTTYQYADMGGVDLLGQLELASNLRI